MSSSTLVRSFSSLINNLHKMTKSGPTFKTKSVRQLRYNKRRARLPPKKRFSMIDYVQTVTVLETPVKSESDKKSYRVIRLSNGLTALLISDPRSFTPIDKAESGVSEESEEGNGSENSASEDDDGADFGPKTNTVNSEDKAAACALCIRAGSYSDPPHIQGMAHFVEHMVFMGSSKYPIENDFDSFVRKKGGTDNAQTDCETTTFYFEIQENHLAESMDRFAQFFVSPLMKKEAMQRERESIESEFSLAIPSDNNRREQLLSATLPVGHPGRTFMWGNNRSLTPPIGPVDSDLYKAAHDFRQRHYSAHRMTVAVQARLTLETLEKFVISTFGQIPTNYLPPDDFSQYKYSPESVTPDFHSFYYVKPVMQNTTLSLTWCMKSFYEDYKSKPQLYVSWIFGHEGAGSLLVYLQRKVWALGIFAGVSDGGIEHTSLMSLFGVTLVLTQEGLENLNQVLDTVFGYINMLKRDCPCERIFKEIQDVEELNFRFKDEVQPYDNVEQLSENMQFYPPEHYITGEEMYFEYNPEGIKNVIENMRPETVNIMLQSQNHPEPIHYDQVEEWFGTEYKKTAISPELVQRWRNMIPESELHLPEPNLFIPDNFDLILPPPYILLEKNMKLENDDESKSNITDTTSELVMYPTLVKRDEHMEVWFKPDYRFDLPYTFVYMHFITPLGAQSAKNACLLDLWATSLNQLLTERLYAADVTGLYRCLYTDEYGLLLKLHGFSQKLPTVVDEITKMFKTYIEGLTEELFYALKDIQTKAYHNTVLKPNKVGKEIRFTMIIQSYCSILDKLKVVQSVMYEDLKEFATYLLDRLYVKFLMQGNLTMEDSIEISDKVMSNLRWNALPEDERPKTIMCKLPPGEKYCRIASLNYADENSVVTNYYQHGITDLKSYCIIEFLMLIMEEPLFNTLRTKEQLGYNVYCMMRYCSGVLGFSITVDVQAGKYNTSYVNDRIENFMKVFFASVQTMSDDSFEQSRTALIKMKNGVDVELKDEVRRNWNEIYCGEYTFNKLVLEIDCLKSLTLDDIRSFLEEHISWGSRKLFKKLSVQIIGHIQKKNDETQHVDKKVKLGDPKGYYNNNGDYSLNYMHEDDSPNIIKNVIDFKNSLQTYDEIKYELPMLHKS